LNGHNFCSDFNTLAYHPVVSHPDLTDSQKDAVIKAADSARHAVIFDVIRTAGPRGTSYLFESSPDTHEVRVRVQYAVKAAVAGATQECLIEKN
jgi:hypothetical protein